MAGMHLEIISPSELLLSERVDYAEIPGSEGYFGVLPGHSLMIVNLRPGVITLTPSGGSEKSVYISGGICEVTQERVTILAERAVDAAQMTPEDSAAAAA